MWRVLRYAIYVTLALGLGVVLNAIFSELPAPTDAVVVPIDLPGEGT